MPLFYRLFSALGLLYQSKSTVDNSKIRPNAAATIDLIRWISAVFVLIYHIRINVVAPYATLPADLHSFFIQFVYTITNCGDQAVLCFFIVSGFLVGGSVVVDVAAQRFDGRRYLVNRIARIYTVSVPALVVGYLLDTTRVAQFGLSSAAGSEIASSYTLSTFIGNILNVQALFVPTLGSNIPLWSLAFEFSYYLLFPPLVLAVDAAVRRKAFFPLLAVAGVLCLLAVTTSGMIPLFSIWILGAYTRIAPAPIIRSRAVSAGLAIAACFAYPSLSQHAGFIAKLIVGVCFANVLLCARFSDARPSTAGAMFNEKLAAFSYSLYLVHAPMLHFVLCFAFDRPDPTLNWWPVGWGPLLCGATLAIFLCGYAFLFAFLTERRTATVKRWIDILAPEWPKRLQKAK